MKDKLPFRIFAFHIYLVLVPWTSIYGQSKITMVPSNDFTRTMDQDQTLNQLWFSLPSETIVFNEATQRTYYTGISANAKQMRLNFASKDIMVTQPNSPKSALKKIESKVNIWDNLPIEKNAAGELRQILEGETTHLEYLEIEAITLLSKTTSGSSRIHGDVEEMVIIKDGHLDITIENDQKVLGAGSIALILPGDKHIIKNTGNNSATYYRLRYRSKSPIDIKRGKKAGGSIMVDWHEVAFKKHENGGRRDFFDRPTAMCKDFEMHATNLNENTQSHLPHTHVVEEIVLMVTGDVKIHIDGSEQNTTKGDLIFLDSNIPHAATNIGAAQCIYFAFQWK